MFRYSGNCCLNLRSADNLYLALLPILMKGGAGFPNKTPVYLDCFNEECVVPSTGAASLSDKSSSRAVFWSFFLRSIIVILTSLGGNDGNIQLAGVCVRVQWLLSNVP